VVTLGDAYRTHRVGDGSQNRGGIHKSMLDSNSDCYP